MLISSVGHFLSIFLFILFTQVAEKNIKYYEYRYTDHQS